MSADFRIARYELPDPAAGKNLSLHINETTVSFPLEASKAQEITSALNELLQTFKDKQAAERPKRWKPMEFRHKGVLSVSPGTFNILRISVISAFVDTA